MYPRAVAVIIKMPHNQEGLKNTHPNTTAKRGWGVRYIHRDRNDLLDFL